MRFSILSHASVLRRAALATGAAGTAAWMNGANCDAGDAGSPAAGVPSRRREDLMALPLRPHSDVSPQKMIPIDSPAFKGIIAFGAVTISALLFLALRSHRRAEATFEFMSASIKHINRTSVAQKQLGFIYPAGAYQLQHDGARTFGSFGFKTAGGHSGSIHADAARNRDTWDFTRLEIHASAAAPASPPDAAAAATAVDEQAAPPPTVIKLV